MSKTGGCLLAVLLLGGCSSLPHSQEVHNYETLPGSSPTMSDKAGLLSGSQKDTYDGGTLVYSTDKSKKSLVHTPDQGEPQHSAGGMNDSGASAASTTVSASSAPASNRAPTTAKPSQARRSDYQQFEKYQQFKKFQQSSPASSERRKFREWQDWKQYQQWRKSGGGQ